MPSFISIPVRRRADQTEEAEVLINTASIVAVEPRKDGKIGCALLFHTGLMDTSLTRQQVQAALMNTDDCSIGRP